MPPVARWICMNCNTPDPGHPCRVCKSTEHLVPYASAATPADDQVDYLRKIDSKMGTLLLVVFLQLAGTFITVVMNIGK